MTTSISQGGAPEPRRTAVSSSPIVLQPNQPVRPYRGGPGIARFRRRDDRREFVPEDFVGSTTEVHDGNGVGLSTIGDAVLRDLVAEDPIGFLGPEHVERFGPATELLVKLLHTGERLFVHYHPDAAFARENFGADRGKTEAWIILDVDRDEAGGVAGWVYLGFNRDVSEEEVTDWIARQDTEAMLAALHRVPIEAGDTVVVPSRSPHAIGPGITLVELQEPSDLSIILEHAGFEQLDAQQALLGLDAEEASEGLDRRRWTDEALGRVMRRAPASGSLFPPEFDCFFQAENIDGSAGAVTLAPSFGILVVTDGAGALEWGSGEMPLEAGMTVLVPFGAGETIIRGSVKAVRCLPPLVQESSE